MVGAFKPKGGNSEQPEIGSYPARLLGVVLFGNQPEAKLPSGAVVKEGQKVEFTFELVGTEMSDGRPFVISKVITNSDWEDQKTGKSTDLVAYCKALMGGNYKEGLYDFKLLLNKPCLVNVGPKPNSEYRKIESVGMLPKGYPELQDLYNKTYIFSPYEEVDLDLWESFPDWKKERIQEAVDHKETELFKQLSLEEEF